MDYKQVSALNEPVRRWRRARTVYEERRLDSVVSVSQADQDYWVYGEVFDEKKNGFFLDVGANDGLLLSNSYLLERRYGWSGICIEGNPDVFQQLEKRRRCICVNQCVDAIEGVVKFAARGLMWGYHFRRL